MSYKIQGSVPAWHTDALRTDTKKSSTVTVASRTELMLLSQGSLNKGLVIIVRVPAGAKLHLHRDGHGSYFIPDVTVVNGDGKTSHLAQLTYNQVKGFSVVKYRSANI